jgi:uridylate kinase
VNLGSFETYVDTACGTLVVIVVCAAGYFARAHASAYAFVADMSGRTEIGIATRMNAVTDGNGTSVTRLVEIVSAVAYRTLVYSGHFYRDFHGFVSASLMWILS